MILTQLICCRKSAPVVITCWPLQRSLCIWSTHLAFVSIWRACHSNLNGMAGWFTFDWKSLKFGRWSRCCGIRSLDQKGQHWWKRSMCRVFVTNSWPFHDYLTGCRVHPRFFGNWVWIEQVALDCRFWLASCHWICVTYLRTSLYNRSNDLDLRSSNAGSACWVFLTGDHDSIEVTTEILWCITCDGALTRESWSFEFWITRRVQPHG